MNEFDTLDSAKNDRLEQGQKAKSREGRVAFKHDAIHRIPEREAARV
jgi:hypothetical protein